MTRLYTIVPVATLLLFAGLILLVTFAWCVQSRLSLKSKSLTPGLPTEKKEKEGRLIPTRSSGKPSSSGSSHHVRYRPCASQCGWYPRPLV